MDGSVGRIAYPARGDGIDGPITRDHLSVDLSANTVACGATLRHAAPRVAELVHILASAYPAPATVDIVMAGLWGAKRPPSAGTALRNAVREARKVMASLDWEIVRLHSRARPALMLQRM